MADNIPSFIKNFSCYYIRIRFQANRAIKFSNPWYFEPRFTIGAAIKKSKHAHLFEDLFKPNQIIDEQGKKISPPSALVIRSANSKRKSFNKGDYLDVYITIIGNQDHLFQQFCEIIPNFDRFHFFKNNNFQFISYHALNPDNNRFQKVNPDKSYQLNYEFFSKNIFKWSSILSIRFLTPTRVRINELFTKQIPYKTLFNRLSRRTYELTKYHIENKVEPYISSVNENLRLSQLNLPKQAIFKGTKKYEFSGFLGWLHYQVEYNEIEAFLWTIAPFVHIGSFTQMGNGHLETQANSRKFYDQVIHKAQVADNFKSEENKVERIQQLKDFTYLPQTYKIVKIPKSDGTYRSLNIAHSDDLLLQRFATEILYQEFTEQFLPQNYAYRKGKGAAEAIRKTQQWKKEFSNSHNIIRCDIDQFFDHIPINLLLSKVQTELKDPFFTYFVNLWLKSGLINRKNEYEINKLGIPQGSALSPILANIFLNDFDKFIARSITKKFIRYADDILLLVPKEKDPLSILQQLNAHLQHNYHLRLNNEFYVGNLQDAFHFLGITFYGRVEKAMHTDKKNKLPQKITNALNLYPTRPEKIKETLKGLKIYYGKLLSRTELERIDDVLKDTYLRFLSNYSTNKELEHYLKENGFLTNKYQNIQWNKPINSNSEQRNIKIVSPKSVQNKLRKQHLKHLKEFGSTHELVITQVGTFVGTTKGKLVVKHRGKVIQQTPIKKIRQISIICDGVTTSSNLVKTCLKNNIHIIYYNYLGQAYATTTSVATIKPKLVQLQLLLSEDKQLIFLQRLAKNKVKNQLKCLRYYAKYYSNKPIGTILKESIHNLKNKLAQLPEPNKEISLEQYKEALFLWEARCAVTYWKSFEALVNYHNHNFDKREYRGTENLINQMLNYGYAILESKVLRTIHIWQLNPAISYFHTSEQGQPGLCYDLIEQYRTIVDKSILALIGKKEKVSQNDNGRLDLETRKKIIAKINEKLFSLQEHKGSDKAIYEIMKWQTGQFRKFVEGKAKLPKFYNATW